MLPIHEMLSRSARDRPRKEAIVFRGRRMSFSELEEIAKATANFIRLSGARKGMRVAIYSPKCDEEVAVIFALAYAGCVLVHVNPSLRDEKLYHVLEECQPAALFYHESKSVAVERARGRGVLPDLLIRMGPNRSAVPSWAHGFGAVLKDSRGPRRQKWRPTTREEDLAAIIYTSGTTARAKGIMVTHGILSESTLVSAQVLGNVAQDRLVSLTPFSFDGALSQLFTMTLVGGTLILQGSHFPKDVVRTLISERITGCHAVPSFWRMLLDRYPSLADYKFPNLRYLSLIGEVYPEEELHELKRIFGNADFYMMYGTTEAFRSTCLTPSDFARKSRSVGKPLPGVEIRLVDERGRQCAPGEIGEIVHRGAFVSPGYWKRNGTATFREDGVHTGDLGVFDEEGYLYFVGRKDNMIKRFGYQVYPEEIEACLETVDGVVMAAVVCAPDVGSGPQIHAFVVRSPGSGLTLEAVGRHCKLHLPHYMMPDDITFRPEIRKTGTFKIDRSALVTSS